MERKSRTRGTERLTTKTALEFGPNVPSSETDEMGMP